MYLKRLDIQGFKSFATATRFELGPGVTCIAGPNGAGKTNVADAVRWVLGEQASRVIRARKTEDIIFSGSAKRSAMGMAEVKITLDNSDGWLPTEFEEVVVGRRAYRSGDNEYYLNHTRVRLRDINELFMKAQVGQNSYAFMGQGLVEQVLTLRPEERRGMIEEAADVRLHRDKLDQSRNRLKATKENLARVDLLTKELAPRIRALERQADRAAVHERLGKELAQALRALYGQQWQDAQEGLAAARAACDQRQEEFDRVRHEAEAAEEGLSSLATAADERRRDITVREEAYRALEDYTRDLQRRITSDEERSAMAAQRREELVAEVASLTSEREGLASLIEDQSARAATLDEQIAAVERPGTTPLDDFDTRLAELRAALAEVERAAAEADSRIFEAEGRLAALAEQMERDRDDLASAEGARREQIAHLRDWAREFARRYGRTLELAEAIERADGDLAGARARVDELHATVRQAESELRAVAAEIDATQARIDAVSGNEIELPLGDAGVMALLAAAGRVEGEEPDPDSRIQGVLGMVGDVLRVPEGLERAIEAALADAVHAVVVQTPEDALAATELLTGRDLGRATIFPLDALRLSPPLALLNERGVVGVASDLIKYEAEFRPLVHALLGRTIVVENLGVARAILRRGLGSVVTLDGVLLHPSGSVAAGSAKPVRRSLRHQRIFSPLPEEMERLRARRQELIEAQEREEAALHDARVAHDRLASELDRVRGERMAAVDALREQRSRLPAIAARLSRLHARTDGARRGIENAEATTETLRAAIERDTAQAAEHRAAADRQRQTIELTAGDRENRAQELAADAARVAGLEAARDALRQQLELQQASLARVEREITRREELSQELGRELETLAARLETARRELEEKSREAEAAREELEPARHSLEQVQTRQRSITEEVTSTRSASLNAERALLEAQSNVRLREEELEALKDRLDEEGFRPSEEGEIELLEPETEPEDGDGPPAWMREAATEDGPPAMRGGAPVDTVALKERISELRAEIRNLGPVNEQAAIDYEESRERYDFLSTQLDDLRKAEASLLEAIDELEAIIKERFSVTFKRVNEQFGRYFETFFGGGQAELLLTEPDDDGLVGVDIVAQPPRKRVKSLNMLSGGERSLTAVALLFALLQINPSPVVVLDEVDAALDEANVDRFTQTLRELAERSQFIIITHNRRTLEMADAIYGVSMGEDSTSSVLSLRLGDLPAK